MKDRRTMMELLRPAGCGWGEGGKGARTEIADPHAANFLSLVTSGLHRFVEHLPAWHAVQSSGHARVWLIVITSHTFSRHAKNA